MRSQSIRGVIAALLLLCACGLYVNLRSSPFHALVALSSGTVAPHEPEPVAARLVAKNAKCTREPNVGASVLCPGQRWARNTDQPTLALPPPTGPLAVFRGGDLESRCELERALAARSRQGELGERTWR